MPVKPPIMPGWDGFDVVRHVQRSLPVPVLVDNDVNIMALGEQRTALLAGTTTTSCSSKSPPASGRGIISSGQLQRGANGTAGDLGHVRVPRGDDVLCRCGNYGCLEALASGPAVAQGADAAGPCRRTTAVTCCAWSPRGTCRPSRRCGRPARDLGDVLLHGREPARIRPSLSSAEASARPGSTSWPESARWSTGASLPLATTHLRIGLSRAGDQRRHPRCQPAGHAARALARRH